MTNVEEGRRLPSRRDLLRGAGLLAAGGLGATACSSPVVSGFTGTGTSRRTLTFWNLFTGGDGERMVGMEDAYRKAHPEVDLNAVALTWGAPYYTKLSLATVGDQPPDVAISHLDRHSTLARSGLITPLDEAELARYGITGDKFSPRPWRQAHVDGKLYAIPLDTHPFVLYYNTKVCKKAGLLDSDGRLKNIDGPTGLLDAMAAAKKASGKWGGVEAVIADPSTAWREFSTLYYQLGGNEILADEGREVILQDDLAQKALAFQADLTIGKELMPVTDYDGATAAFTTGQAGFYFQGPWEVTTMVTAKMPFSMALYPNVFGKPAAFGNSHAFVLPKNDARDAERMDMSLTFIRFLLDNSLPWSEGGQIAAWKPVQDSEEYKKLQPQSNVVGAADIARYTPPAWYAGAGSNFDYTIGSVVISVKSGRLTPAAGVKQIRGKLEEFAKIPPPTVR